VPDAADRDERIQQALQLLIDEVRERIDRHPLGHLVAGRGGQIDLRLTLPTALRDGQLGRAGRDAAESLQEAVQDLLHLLLLAGEADPSIKESGGLTPLDMARSAKKDAVVAALTKAK